MRCCSTGTAARRGAWDQRPSSWAWRPGDRPRLIVRADPTGAGGVYLVDAETLAAAPLPVPATAYDVAFSPDGQRVLYATTEGLGRGSALWLMNADGSGATLLLDDPQHVVARPRWSPDGERWAYIRMPDSAAPFPIGELWVMDSAGARRLSDRADAGHGYPPAWSPDGQSIVFVTWGSGDADGLARRVYLADPAK